MKADYAVIVDAVRTPMGRSKGGVFRMTRAESLAAAVMRAVLERNPSLDPGELDDVIFGCVNQSLEQGFNISRQAALLAGIPPQVPAQTVNRLCASSMTALHTASMAIESGQGRCYLVGGVEHMGHLPMGQGVDIAPQLSLYASKVSMHMGATAELLAQMYAISREAQDAFALESQKRAATARDSGLFMNEIVPVPGHDAQGLPVMVSKDESIRETCADSLAALRPVFMPAGGTITAGNASAVADGASAVLVMSAEYAADLGLEPMARVRGLASAGCDPATMGLGPVYACRKLMAATKIRLPDIDVFELNEAFAAQTLAVIQQLDIQPRMADDINSRGGAIALGHPLGCSGARIITTLVHQLQAEQKNLGLASMCVGMGQGVATLLERT